MDKHRSSLLSWFDREQPSDTPDIPPVLVTRERAREARLYLREHSAFEYEKFRQEIEVDSLICDPLGETSECLSAEDLSSLIRSHMQEPPEALDVELIAHAVSHIQNCQTCFENVAAYQEMECRTLESVLTRQIQAVPSLLWIGPIGRVEVVEGAEPSLGLWVATHDIPERDLTVPMTARFSCPFETREIPLHQVECTSESERRGVPRAQQLIKAYYQTARLAELQQVKDNACGFVTVSQQVGVKELHSTRVIRMAKDVSPFARSIQSGWMARKSEVASPRRVVVLRGHLAASTESPIIGRGTTGRFQIELGSAEHTRRHAKVEVRVGPRASIGVRWLSGSLIRRKGDSAPLGRSAITLHASQGVTFKKVLEEAMEWVD